MTFSIDDIHKYELWLAGGSKNYEKLNNVWYICSYGKEM